MQEVGRRIQWIDVPGVTFVGPLDASALLQNEAIARTRLGELLIEGLFRTLVGQTEKLPGPFIDTCSSLTSPKSRSASIPAS